MRKLFMGAAAAAALACSGPAMADGSLFFLIDGDTFNQPFSLTNNSTGGETILSFGFDLSGTGVVFDPVTGGPPGNGTAGVPFTPVGSSGVTTGLTGSPTIVDGSTFFQIFFNSFNVGETFSFLLDVDPADPNASATVLGNALIGATVFADFSNGLRGTGRLVAVTGNPDASQFVISTVTQTPSGVPEPGTWAMMLLGFGGIGFAVRRDRRSKREQLQTA